jgi:hypothetical protein
VLIASDDATTAVRMLKALNPRRYRVEHIFDLNEAMLRAELVLAHALVIHAPSLTSDLARRCARGSGRLAWIFVSPAPGVETLARGVGGLFVSQPFETDDFKRAVFRGVTTTHERRTGERPESREPLSERVLLLLPDSASASVVAAVITRELSVRCDWVPSAEAAVPLLSADVNCVVVEAELLFGSEAGSALATELAQRGISILSVKSDRADAVDNAGQLAWELLPRLRVSLNARR